MDELSPRLRAVCDLNVAEVREFSGRHEYDGTIQDLSRDGVTSGLDRMAAAAAAGPQLGDPHDEAHLAAFENATRASLGDLELHRRNPLLHMSGLDLACYEREYAPQLERDAARAAHLARWPEAIDAAIASLDQLSAPVAAALADGIRGLPAGIPVTAGDRPRRDALAAHARLVAHIDQAVADGPRDAALGPAALTVMMSSADAMPVDLGLAQRARRR